jgi:hypothetical protein
MSESRRLRLSRARDVGLAKEMAGVRGRVREVLAANPDDPKLLLWAAQVLAQAATAEKRLDPLGGKELSENLQIVLDNFASQLKPEPRDGDTADG